MGFKNYGELSLITKMASSISVIENTLMSILDKGIHILIQMLLDCLLFLINIFLKKVCCIYKQTVAVSIQKIKQLINHFSK